MTVSELANALEDEATKVRADVSNWGLDPEGQEQVLLALVSFANDTADDLAAHLHYQGKLDVAPSLAARLENVKNLKVACIASIQGAKRCDWLAQWMATASPKRGLHPSLASKKTQSHLIQ